MKRKMKGVLGIGIAFMLVASLMTFAIPVAADPYEPLVPPNPNMWDGFTPTPGGPPLDLWFYDPDIGYVGPMAEAINGDLYAAVGMGFAAILGASGINDAQWSATQVHSGSTSAKLIFTTGGNAYVEFVPPAGITFSDLATITTGWSWWYYFDDTSGYGPILELRFTGTAYNATTGAYHVDITVNTAELAPVQQTWTQETVTSSSTATCFGNDATGTAFSDITYGGASTGGFTLSALVTGVTALVSGSGDWELTRVRAEIGWNTDARDCYIDDITIAGVTYNLEGENGSTGPGTALSSHLFLSTDGARTWSQSTYPAPCTQAGAGYYNGGPVVDMVCSDLYEDVIYVTDGNYVYKSVNGGITFSYVAAADLEGHLMGACKTSVVNGPITCIDVGYDGADKPVVFIGTRNVGHLFPATHPDNGYPIVGSVYWIADETFPASWTDLELRCCCCSFGPPIRDVEGGIAGSVYA